MGTEGERNGGIVPQRTRIRIAYTITGIWTVSVLTSIGLSIRGDEWQPNPWLMMTMVGLAAAVFGSNFVKGIK